MRKEEFITPSGLKFVLREQVGSDDDKVNAAQSESVMINTYVANVIVEGPKGGLMIPEEVKKLRLGDKYFLTIASRILSLGETMYFAYQWGEEDPTEYTEDLSRYIWDYAKDFPEKGSPEFFDQRIKPYPSQEFIDGEIRGIKLRMDYMDGVGEDYLLKLPENERTVNKELIARNLRIFDKDWKIVANFDSFSAKDMVYIRNLAHDNDPAIEGLTSIQDPVSGQVLKLPLIAVKDFFFPVKI